jgi:hypothetical protein
VKCKDCERCQWDPDRDCGNAEHPHCPGCGHCCGRHGDWVLPNKAKESA